MGQGCFVPFVCIKDIFSLISLMAWVRKLLQILLDCRQLRWLRLQRHDCSIHCVLQLDETSEVAEIFKEVVIRIRPPPSEKEEPFIVDLEFVSKRVNVRIKFNIKQIETAFQNVFWSFKIQKYYFILNNLLLCLPVFDVFSYRHVINIHPNFVMNIRWQSFTAITDISFVYSRFGVFFFKKDYS